MPVNTKHTTIPSDIVQDINCLKISNEKFADFSTIVTFPKDCITTKMIQLTNHNETFLISCLTGAPLAVVKDRSVLSPKYSKNDLIPLKPIQKLNSFAESSGNLILSHGDHSLEFGKLSLDSDDGFLISRFCQRTTEKPYKKILFENENRFFGKSDSQVDLYDFMRISRICSINSKANILDFDFCPMQPSVLAYSNGNLNIIDVREGMECRSLYKQTNPGGLIKWNPIVPYWIASASTDSLNIYDIRYNSPLPVISLHHSHIHSLCWSAVNSDLILAASSDRRANLWSINRGEEDCRLGMKINRFELGSIAASNDRNHLFYGLDGSDSLIKIKIRPEYLTSIAPEHDNFDYKDIGAALYCSDYTNFCKTLSEITRENFESGNYAKLKQLVLLTTPSQSKTIKFDEKILASIEIEKDFKEFKELLKQSTGIFAFKDEELEEIHKFADQIRLKIRIAELLAAEDIVSLKMFLNLIISSYCTDLNFLSRSQSIKLMALLLKSNRQDAFTFLSEIIRTNPFGAPEIIQIWIWMACYPTIFDSKSFELIMIRPSLSKSVADLEQEFEEDADELQGDVKIEKYLEWMRYQFYDSWLQHQQIGPHFTKIIHQISLNLGAIPIDFEKLTNPDLEEINAALLEGRADASIISAEIVKLLLEYTLRRSSDTKTFMTDFFLASFRLQILTEKTPIYSGIQEFITTIGFSRLKFLLIKAKDQLSISRAINSIITIGTDQYSTISEDQLNYLADRLQLLADEISDFSMIYADFKVDNALKSLKFRNELKRIKEKCEIQN